MSTATTPTTTTPQDTSRAQAIFCQPSAPDNALLTTMLTDDDVTMMQDLIQQAGQSEQLTASNDGLAGSGVSRLEGLARIRVARAVLDRARGLTWLDLAERGDSYAIIHALAIRDKAVSKLFDQGEVAFRAQLAAALEAKAAKRAARPLKKYVIGRVDKDQDGVLKHPETGELLEIEPDNGKLLELMLEKTHPAYKKQEAESDKGGSGRPIVYNIAFIGGPAAAVAIPRAQEAIEASFTEAQGGNQAAKSPFG